MRRQRLRAAAALLVVGLVTACGSTVQLTGAGPAALPGGGDGLGGPMPAATTALPQPGSAAPGGAPVTGPTGAPAPGRTASGPTQPPTSGPTGGSSLPGRRGPGVSASSVRIGFQYVDVGTGTGAVLGQNISLGDPEQQARAVAAYINKHGGMGGRKLELVPFGVAYGGYVGNPQVEFSRVCNYYTQDEKVAAVALYVPDETLIDCLAKKDVISVADGYSLDRQVHERYARHYYAPGSMSQDRGAEVGVQGLSSVGFFKNATIGVLRYDSPPYVRAEKSLNTALAAAGLKSKTTFAVRAANTTQASSDVSAAVLRFRAEGVTHVLVLDNSGGIATTFMTSAQSQGYHPKYGLTTNNAPSAQRQLSPAAQLVGAVAVSWWWGDVGPELEHATPPALPSSRSTCLKIMSESGADLSGKAAQGSAVITCDQLLFLKTLFDRAGAPASESLEAAADALGSAYSSTLSYRTTIGRGRHDGATLTRIIRYDEGCACWKYAGPGPTA